MAHPVVHWEITAKDLNKQSEFYSQLFDWKMSGFGSDYNLVDTGGGGINGGIMQLPPGIPDYRVVFYVKVDDLQAYLDKAERLGGKMVVPPTPIPNVGGFAMFTDPEGHVVGLFKG